MDNKYYVWWKENKIKFSLLPAVVFWLASMIFFVAGMKFANPIVVLGLDFSLFLAVSLALANTFIQVIGNEQSADELGLPLYLGWLASYVLGIGTNVYGLLSVLSMNNVYLEWIVALSLGTMIEVLPEKFLVQFLKGFRPSIKTQTGFHQTAPPKYVPPAIKNSSPAWLDKLPQQKNNR